MQVVGHYLGWNFSGQFKQIWVNLKVRTLKILIKLMVVFLHPKFIKAFNHGCFIPKPAFMPCLSRSSAPCITLLDIHKDSVGDTPHSWLHIVRCSDTLSLAWNACQMQHLNLCCFNRFFSLEHLSAFCVSLLLPECGFTHQCSLS